MRKPRDRNDSPISGHKTKQHTHTHTLVNTRVHPSFTITLVLRTIQFEPSYDSIFCPKKSNNVGLFFRLSFFAPALCVTSPQEKLAICQVVLGSWFCLSMLLQFPLDWCCFYYFLRNSLVALLDALFARQVNKSTPAGPLLRARKSWSGFSPRLWTSAAGLIGSKMAFYVFETRQLQ